MVEPREDWDDLRRRLIGLGEQSSRKSYYPELKRKLAELKESEERFQSIFNSVSDAIFIHDAATGEVHEVNQRCCEMYGMSRDEVVQRLFAELDSDPVAPFSQQESQRRLRLAADGEPQIFEWRARHKEGRYFWVEVSLKRAKIGSKDCIVASVRDIESRKQAEQERIDFERQLLHVQKLESLGVLAGGIAHDFNNLLTVIIGNAELARLRSKADSPILVNLERIQQAAQNAADLARQMLAYSGKGKFEVEIIDLNQMIDDLVSMLEVSIGKNVTLGLQLQRPLPGIEGDATQLHQVLMNLVINASEAIGDAEGSVTVKTRVVDHLSDDDLLGQHHDALPQGRYLCLEVSDSGCGMDEATLKKLFDPFFTTKFTGRGLGMAAVLGIVNSHQGAIRVASTPGRGTTFTLLFPVSDQRIAMTVKADKSHWQGIGTVLLVDDEQTVRDIGKEMLGELGFRVLTADDGQEALVMVAEHPEIWCVILDLTMPVMGGEQCFAELRKRVPNIKVVLSSGYDEQEVIGRFVGAGMAGFIRKPYQLKNLREALGRLA